MAFYFAYGSNLNIIQIQQRCPNVRFIRTATLSKYKLIFNGHASIEYTGNIEDKVYGVIFELSVADETQLDLYEGISTNIYKKVYFELSIFNVKTKVMSYVKIKKGNNPPESYYLNKIKKGYKFWGLPLSILKDIPVKKEKYISGSFNNFSATKNKEYITNNSNYNYISNFNNKYENNIDNYFLK